MFLLLSIFAIALLDPVLHVVSRFLLFSYSYFEAKLCENTYIFVKVSTVKAHLVAPDVRCHADIQILICDLQVAVIEDVPLAKTIKEHRIHDVSL